MIRGAGPAEPTLGSRAASALGWSLLNTAVGRFGTLAIGVVLARLLGPTEFGVFAVATVALLAILSFNDLGISLAIVRWDDEPKRIAPTVNSVAVLSSAVLTALVWLLAAPYADAMAAPGATWPVRWLSISILINGLVATPAAALQREMMQRHRLVIDQLNVWSGAITSVALALLGWGAMSLAVGRLVGSLLSAVLFLRWSPIQYRFGADRVVARRLLRFGMPLAGASIIVFVTGYLDQLIVGLMLGPQALGFYVLAVNLAGWPVSLFSQPLRSVTPALLARIRADPSVTDHATRTLSGLLAAVAAPACAMLAVAAGPVVHLVYGAAWAPAARILTWLALFALVRIAVELCYDILVVLSPTHRLLIAQAIWIAVLAPALVTGAATAGGGGAGIAQLAVGALVALPLYGWLMSRAGISLRGFAHAAAVPVAVAASGAIVTAAIVHWAGTDGLALGGSIVIGCAMVAALQGRIRTEWRALGDIGATTPQRAPARTQEADRRARSGGRSPGQLAGLHARHRRD